MVIPVAATVKPNPRFLTPPWDRTSPQWLAIDAALPADHPARALRAALDRLDATALHPARYRAGSEAYPLDLMLAIALYEIHDGRNSPAQWARDARDRDSLKWLGFGIRPSRSRSYAFRDRMAGRLAGLLHQVLAIAQAEGRTPATHAALDGTAIAAVASRHKLLNHATLEKRSGQLDEACAADAAGVTFARVAIDAAATFTADTAAGAGAADAADTAAGGAAATFAADTAAGGAAATFTADTAAGGAAATFTADTATGPYATATATATAAAAAAAAAARPAWMAATAGGRRRQRRRYHEARETAAVRIAANARRPPSERRDPAKIVVSPSEPAAVLGPDKTKVFRPLYNAQLAYDLDSEFILGCGVFALPTDVGTLGPMLETIRAVTGRKPAVLLVDAKYGNMIDVATCEREGVTLYAPAGNDVPPTPPPASARAKAKAKPKPIPKSAFTWDPQRREYRCPEGHAMPMTKRVSEERSGGVVAYEYYRCPGEHCRACPRREACSTSPQGRTVSRAEQEELLERLRQRMATAEAKALYRRRRETVERGFADARRHRKQDRFHGRGVERATTELELLVLAHNLMVLARHPGSPEVPHQTC